MLQLRVNGIHSAWMAEFGHDCAHCNEIRDADPYRVANVSYSLIQRRPDGAMRRHTLVDCGLGVMQSLLDFERTHDVHVVHEVFLSHSHFDHVAHLDWLSSAVRRNGRRDQPRPLTVHCTEPCWQTGPQRLFPWLAGSAMVHNPVVPGRAIDVGALRVTPIAVEHGSTAPGAVSYAIEVLAPDPGDPKKVVLTCDLLRPASANDPAWFGADVCFIEANTWNRNPDTGHQCIKDALQLVRTWGARRTYLIHYSGYEDARHVHSEVNRPLTWDELGRQVRRAAPDLDVRIAHHGMILPLDEHWP